MDCEAGFYPVRSSIRCYYCFLSLLTSNHAGQTSSVIDSSTDGMDLVRLALYWAKGDDPLTELLLLCSRLTLLVQLQEENSVGWLSFTAACDGGPFNYT